MSDRLLAVAAGLLLAAAAVVGAAYVGGRLLTSPADRAFHDAFEQVEIGMSERQVLDLLGASDERSTEFYLGQRLGYEDAYGRTAESGSKYFLVWRRDLDVVYSIGIDASGRVTIAELGGT